MRSTQHAAIGLLCSSLLLVPIAAEGQTTGIAGVVRDSSGGVIPGVTVEASSPALIEKVRTAVTDGQGLYRIVDLRPGVYSVTFSLPGFSTVMLREALPVARSLQTMAQVIPGMVSTGGNRPSGQDVGGLSGERGQVMIHGSRPQDMTIQLDGLSWNLAVRTGGAQGFTQNPAEAQEFVTHIWASGWDRRPGPTPPPRACCSRRARRICTT